MDAILGRAVRATLATAMVLALTPGIASAAQRYAEPGGDGTHASGCLIGDPCDINTAVNLAATNDDVTLLGGVPPAAPFEPGGTVTIPPSVTVHGAPGARPVITAPFGPVVTLTGTGSVLRDAVVRFTGTGTSQAIGIRSGLMERVTAHTTDEDGSNAVHTCLFSGNGGAGVTATIKDSVCWHDAADSAAGGGLGAFANTGETNTLTLRNVTSISTPAVPAIYASGFTNMPASGGDVTVKATNVIARGGPGAVADIRAETLGTGSTAVVTLDHSNYATRSEFPGAGTAPGDATVTDPTTNDNQTTAPVFADAAAGEFRQTEASTSTINLGVAGTVNGVPLGASDFEGQGRMAGTEPDIGADELPMPTVPVLTGTNPPSGANNNNPLVIGTADPLSNVTLFANGTCTPPSTGPGGTGQTLASPGLAVAPVADNSSTTYSAIAASPVGTSGCSTQTVAYSEVTPPPLVNTPVVETGQRAAALAKCKKKRTAKAKRKCRRRANQLPL